MNNEKVSSRQKIGLGYEWLIDLPLDVQRGPLLRSEVSNTG